MPNDSKQVVLEYYDRLNSHDLSSAADLLSPDCRVTVADAQLDRSAYLEFLGLWMTGFPDLRTRLDEVIAEGSSVVVRSTWEGTHDGTFLGAPPTGRRVTFGSFSTSRVQDGRIAERRILANLFGVLQQIGDLSWRVPPKGEQVRDIAMDLTATLRSMPVAE